jgi:hypothetical protein
MNLEPASNLNMKDRWMPKAWLLVLLLALAACGDGNPILGRWVVDAEQSPPGSATGLEMAGSDKLEFLEDRVIAGSSSLDVTYIVEDDRVTVTTLQGQGTVYEFESRDQMSVETPMGPIIFRRIEVEP